MVNFTLLVLLHFLSSTQLRLEAASALAFTGNCTVGPCCMRSVTLCSSASELLWLKFDVFEGQLSSTE